MKIALIGYGRMGMTIEELALSRGHEIIIRIDKNNLEDISNLSPDQVDLAIEFTDPGSAFGNISFCLQAGIPVVSGTTGWNNKLAEAIKLSEKSEGALFYASNYSIGVNIMFEINKRLANLVNRFADYNVELSEIHHIHKLDSPSGTAITLADGIIENIDRFDKWRLGESGDGIVEIEAVREGEVPGTHIVNFENETDKITISHEAKDRKGFALGAVLVGEWLKGKKGFYSMEDFLNL